MNAFIDNIGGQRTTARSPASIFSTASLDLSGCPCVGRCGPLVTPNLYTPPGVALTVCDTVALADHLLGHAQQRHRHARRRDQRGLRLSSRTTSSCSTPARRSATSCSRWVSQEQGDVQIIGYVEGAPPAPMANLTNKSSYAGATSVTFTRADLGHAQVLQQRRHLKRDTLGLGDALRHRRSALGCDRRAIRHSA